jgi:hypothetical protein
VVETSLQNLRALWKWPFARAVKSSNQRFRAVYHSSHTETKNLPASPWTLTMRVGKAGGRAFRRRAVFGVVRETPRPQFPKFTTWGRQMPLVRLDQRVDLPVRAAEIPVKGRRYGGRFHAL